MSKERFEWRYNEEVLKHYIFDNIENKQLAYKDIINLLNEQYQQIDQLKQQLEESFTEEDVEGLIEDRDKTIKFLQKELAEKDKEINSLIVDYEKRISQEQELMSNMEHQLAEKQNEIDEINKEFVQAVHDWKTLCAEKDKEIEGLKTKQELTFMHSKEYYFQRCNLLEESNIKLQFTQAQLAIQELEKVKNFVDGRTFCANYIKKRIKELKGEKDEV